MAHSPTTHFNPKDFVRLSIMELILIITINKELNCMCRQGNNKGGSKRNSNKGGDIIQKVGKIICGQLKD